MRPATFARITGAVYLLYFLSAIGGGQLSGGVTVLGSVSADAIGRSTYQPGLAVGEVSTLLYLALVVLLYRLLQGVNNTAALLALVFGATGCAVTAIAAVFQHAAPLVAGAEPALALAFLKANGQALHVALVFFAGFDAFMGFLIFRSGFLPRFIGVLMLVAGAGWLAALAPAVPSPLAIAIAAVGGLAELALMSWLLAFGVRKESAAGRGDALAQL